MFKNSLKIKSLKLKIPNKVGITIGIDASRAFVEDPAGPEYYSLNIIKSLAKIDKLNSYILYLRPGQSPNFKLPENFTAKQLRWPRLWTQIGLAAEIFRHKPDVLFIPAHTLPLLTHFILPQLPIVVTVHGLEGKFLPQSGNKLSHFYRNWSIGWAVRFATGLIAVSDNTRTDVIQTYHISPDKIKTVHEGVDISRFAPILNFKFSAKGLSTSGGKILNSRPKVDSYKTRNNSFNMLADGETYRVHAEKVLTQIINKDIVDYLLFVGTVQPRKNLIRLLKAYAKILSEHKNVSGFRIPKLIIVGKLGWTYKTILSTYKRYNLQEHCTFLGRVDDETLVELYKGAKIFILPSITEGFGLPVLEAQATGVPVVVSRAGALPEVAGNGAIYINPLSVDDIKNKIYKVLKDEKLRHNLIRKGYDNVNRFTWDNTAYNTLRILEEITSK